MKTSVTAIENASWNTPLVLRGGFEKSIHIAAEIGYDGIELHISDPILINRGELKRELAGAGILITSIGTGPSYSRDRVFFTSEDKDVREEALRRMRGHIELGADLGAVVIIGLIKGQRKDLDNKTEYDERFYDAMEICIRDAKRCGTTLAIEVIDRFESDWLNTIEEGIDMLDHIRSPFLTLHLDTFHMNIEEPNIYRSVLSANGRVGHVHVADSDRWYVGHAHFDFQEFFRGLNEINYDGAVALESFPYPDIITASTKSLMEIKRYI